MKHFDVQGIEIAVPCDRAFATIANPVILPRWAEAFESASESAAVLRTPQGRVEVGLETLAAAQFGTVDWHITFPDGSVAKGYSRLVELGPERCAFVFVLTPPPVPLEALEGALEAQSETLARELVALKGLLESQGG
jgi:hypothetical protein